MRILLVTRDFPPFHGGVAQVAYGLGAAFRGLGHEVEVHCSHRRGLSPPNETYPFSVRTVSGKRDEGDHRTFPAALRDYRQRSGDPDLMVAVHWKAARSTARTCARAGIRLFTVLHAKEVTERIPLPLLLLLRRLLARSEAIICVSRFTADEAMLRFRLPAAKVTVIHPGVDPAIYHPAPSAPGFHERYGLGDGPVILTMARVIARKGHDVVVRALPAVLERHPAAVYVVCGKPFEPFASRLKALVADMGLSAHVRFTGHVPAADVVEMYRACAVCVMPSRIIEKKGDTEGFGITFIEAGACGKPVIGGREAGVVDAIVDGETGLLVDPADPAAVADALNRILGDPGLARAMGEAGRLRVEAGFTWDAIARRYLAL
jgi:phosphatidylinositol alpha-1,6-mannosyltransferase